MYGQSRVLPDQRAGGVAWPGRTARGVRRDGLVIARVAHASTMKIFCLHRADARITMQALQLKWCLQ